MVAVTPDEVVVGKFVEGFSVVFRHLDGEEAYVVGIFAFYHRSTVEVEVDTIALTVLSSSVGTNGERIDAGGIVGAGDGYIAFTADFNVPVGLFVIDRCYAHGVAYCL